MEQATEITPTATPAPREPQLGDRVLYTLSSYDVSAIDNVVPKRDRNPVQAKQELPATVVAVFGGSVNLRVHLDGAAGDYWATSRAHGIGSSFWRFADR